MTRQRQRQLVFFDTAAVITNANKFRPTAFDINIDPMFKGVLTRDGDYFISVMGRSDCLLYTSRCV